MIHFPPLQVNLGCAARVGAPWDAPRGGSVRPGMRPEAVLGAYVHGYTLYLVINVGPTPKIFGFVFRSKFNFNPRIGPRGPQNRIEHVLLYLPTNFHQNPTHFRWFRDHYTILKNWRRRPTLISRFSVSPPYHHQITTISPPYHIIYHISFNIIQSSPFI